MALVWRWISPHVHVKRAGESLRWETDFNTLIRKDHIKTLLVFIIRID